MKAFFPEVSKETQEATEDRLPYHLAQGGDRHGPVQRIASVGRARGRGPLPAHGGKEMPEEVQAKMEEAFNADFSSVRIHEGAQMMSPLVRAYTRGMEVYFASGEYKPRSQSGQEILGHELAHVVQQSQGRVPVTTQMKGVAVNDDAGLEREADEMGARAARGERTDQVSAFALGAALQLRTGSHGASEPVQAYTAKNAKEKKEVAALRQRYVTANNDDIWYETQFNDYVEDASTMDEIRKFVGDAEAKKKSAKPPSFTPSTSTSTTTTSVSPPPLSTSFTPSTSTSTTSTSTTSTSTTSKPKKQKEKKKQTTMSLESFNESLPPVNAWASGRPQFGTSSTSSTSATNSTSAAPHMQVDDEPTPVPNNEFIRNLISSGRNSYTVRSIDVDGGATADTVYYKIVVAKNQSQTEYGRLMPFRSVYTLYLHYHPAATTNNWLHIKKTHGGTPENIVGPNNWLLAGHPNVLRAGMQQWANATGKTVTHPIVP